MDLRLVLLMLFSELYPIAKMGFTPWNYLRFILQNSKPDGVRKYHHDD
jgi:hypothetical protein